MYKQLLDTSWGDGHGPRWIFIHDTDKAEEGLIVLFFDFSNLLSPLPLPPGNFSADALVCHPFLSLTYNSPTVSLSSLKTVYRVSLTTQKYSYTSFSFGTWLSNLHV